MGNRAEYLKDKILTEVYDTVSWRKQEDIFTFARSEAEIEFRLLPTKSQLLLSSEYDLDDMFNDICRECLKMKVEADKPPDGMTVHSREG